MGQETVRSNIGFTSQPNITSLGARELVPSSNLTFSSVSSNGSLLSLEPPAKTMGEEDGSSSDEFKVPLTQKETHQGENPPLHQDLRHEIHQRKNSHSYQTEDNIKGKGTYGDSSINMPEGYYTHSQLIPPPIEKDPILVNGIEGRVSQINFIEGRVSEIERTQLEELSVQPGVKDLGSDASVLEGGGEVDYFLPF